MVRIETRLTDHMLALAFAAGNELLALVGPAGAGKSVVLRSIAGVYQPDNGTITLRGRVVFQSSIGVSLPPNERRVGYVPQHFALFPHLNVGDNVSFPLRRGRPEFALDAQRRVAEALDLLGIMPLRDALPGDLHDMERWRVALARALIVDPDVLLLDDAFAALDVAARRQARAEFAALRRTINVPALVATGDLDEACDIAGRIGVLDAGQLLQLDAPDTILTRPATRQVARIVGSSNVISGIIGEAWRDGLEIETALGPLRATTAPAGFGAGYAVDLVIRPDQVRLLGPHERAPDDDNIIDGEIIDEFIQNAIHALTIRHTGSDYVLHVLVSDLAYQQLGLATHKRPALVLPRAALHVMARA